MTDTVTRATWRAVVSFMLSATVIGGAIYAVRVMNRQEAAVATHAAFGGGDVSEPVTVYVTEGQPCESYFTEPFETCVVVMYDLFTMTISTHEASRIGISVGTFIDYIERAGYKVSDIAVVVHNHFVPTSFTAADKATYQALKGRGFRGSFGIWYVTTKRFVAIEETK